MEALAATLVITPPEPLATACFGPRNVPSTRIVGTFESNILCLREEGKLLVVVSIDWFFVSPGMRKAILGQCGNLLSEESLVVAASHTHTSPNTDYTKNGFSSVNSAYVSSIETSIATRIEELIREGKWRTVNIRSTVNACDYTIHRRRKIWWPSKAGLRKKMAVYPNPEGGKDTDLRLLRIEDATDQSLIAIVWSISCHPTEWPRLRELTPDFPALVRDALRNQSERDVPILFLQGFCGDLRPPAIGYWLKRGSLRVRLLMFLCTLLNGRCFAGFSPLAYDRWVKVISEAAKSAATAARNQPESGTGLHVKRELIKTSDLGLYGEADHISIHFVDVGASVRFVCVSAEIVWQYAEYLRSIDPQKLLWPVGYVDHVFGYLPTQQMITEGGYEVIEFKPLFGLRGSFNKQVEETICSAFQRCTEEAATTTI